MEVHGGVAMWVHFHARMVSRASAGSKSAAGAAAYQARERIEARGLVHDYTRRGDLVHKEILLSPLGRVKTPAFRRQL